MVIKEYASSINIHWPDNYFEKWYGDVWRRRVKAPTIGYNALESILNEELAAINASVDYHHTVGLMKVTFRDEGSYTLFVLRWS